MKEVVREAVRKEQIVPGKIRVISIFLALIVATVVTTAVVLGDVQRKTGQYRSIWQRKCCGFMFLRTVTAGQIRR